MFDKEQVHIDNNDEKKQGEESNIYMIADDKKK